MTRTPPGANPLTIRAKEQLDKPRCGFAWQTNSRDLEPGDVPHTHRCNIIKKHTRYHRCECRAVKLIVRP